MAADTAIVLSQIADDQIFTEMKKDYAKEMVTGFIRLNGMTVGAVAESYKKFTQKTEQRQHHLIVHPQWMAVRKRLTL